MFAALGLVASCGENNPKPKYVPFAETPPIDFFHSVTDGEPPLDKCFSWPASGAISSYFSPIHPEGIDIDTYQDPAQKIKAALDGNVAFAGGDPCCSYGLHSVLNHSNGLFTLYAHMSNLDVKTGQNVKTGDILGQVGKTGYATGIHLHFEIRRLKELNKLSEVEAKYTDKNFWELNSLEFYFYDPLQYLSPGNNPQCSK